jgi:succinate dehydrogenase / fumarate reductase cytochrome b subunit
MWLLNSSVGKKVIMSVSGIALVLFLLFHMSMNLVAIFSGEAYNMICEFLGANWYALVATAGLAALVIVHFVYAIILTLQNKKARGGQAYAYTAKPKEVEWASQNMFVLGVIVILGMGLHLYNFWAEMQLVEVMHMLGANVDATYAADGVYHIKQTFSCPVYTVIYLVWLVALWFHLTHGFWSALQTLGWNNQVWFERWRCIGNVIVTIIIAGFAAVALIYAFCPCAGGC